MEISNHSLKLNIPIFNVTFFYHYQPIREGNDKIFAVISFIPKWIGWS